MTNSEPELKKSLTLPILVILSITSVVGSGIFFVPAISVQMSGGSAILAWIIVAVLSMLIILYFAELASMFPSLGGVYEFAKQAYNKFAGFLVGWTEWVIGNLTTAMLVVSALQFIIQKQTVVIFGLSLSSQLFKIILGVITIAIFNYVAFRGIEFSSKFVMTFGIIQILLILLVTFLAFFSGRFSLDNFQPFFLSQEISLNFTNLFITLIFISDIFLGMEGIFSLSEETKNPSKVVPKAVIIAQIILSVISITSLIAIIGFFGVENLVNHTTESPANPGWVYSAIGYRFFGEKGVILFSVLIFLSILGSAADWIISTPRLLMAMARDKLFIPQLNKVHQKYKTPYRAIVFQTIIMTLFIVIGLTKSGYQTLVQILMPLSFTIVISMLVAVTYLRIKKPYLERPFRAPFAKIGPVIIGVILITILSVWIKYQANATILFGVSISFVLIGFPFYLLMQFYSNENIKKLFNEHLTRAYLLLEGLSLPKGLRKEILTLIGDLRNKTIVEYGCGVGTLTKELIKESKSSTTVIAVDLFIKNLNLVKKRINKIINKKGIVLKEFQTVHDPKFELKFNSKADVLIFNSILDSISDLDSFLVKVRRKLRTSGQIYFIEFCDLFGFLPNPPYLMDEEKLEEKFRKHNFAVRLMKRPGLLWNYLIIYGFKVETKDIDNTKISVI